MREQQRRDTGAVWRHSSKLMLRLMKWHDEWCDGGKEGMLHAGWRTLRRNISMIILRLPAENKKVLAVQSCSQAKEKTEGGKDGWRGGRELKKLLICLFFFFYPVAPHICACFTPHSGIIFQTSSKIFSSLHPEQSLWSSSFVLFFAVPIFFRFRLHAAPPPSASFPSASLVRANSTSSAPHRFQPLFLLLLLYMGNTRKPEKVEYFHPPMRFPLSSLRYARSPFSIWIRTPLLAASRVTSWSPAKAEITGQPLCIRLTWSRQKRAVSAMERDFFLLLLFFVQYGHYEAANNTILFVCWFVFLTPLLTWKIRTLTKYQETKEKKSLSAASCRRDVIYADINKGKSPFHLHLGEE